MLFHFHGIPETGNNTRFGFSQDRRRITGRGPQAENGTACGQVFEEFAGDDHIIPLNISLILCLAVQSPSESLDPWQKQYEQIQKTADYRDN